ncbi:MAG: DUF3313 domain-containing protein [Pseudomonadota bacterium]
MRTMAKVIGVVVIGVMFSISTAVAGDPPFSGFLGGPEVYKQLTPGPEGGAKLRWLKPGMDFSKYNKFIVESVIFYLADDSEYKGIDPATMKELADDFNYQLVEAFKDKYPIVSEPGPDVARIRFAITNIHASKPVVSAITTVVPVGLGVSLLKKGVTGGWTGSGETGGELIVYDSMSNEPIIMAVDEQSAPFQKRFTKLGSTGNAFFLWAERTVAFIDTSKGITR